MVNIISNVDGRLIIKDLNLTFTYKGQLITIKDEAFNLSKDIKEALNKGYITIIKKSPIIKKEQKIPRNNNRDLDNLIKELKSILNELKQQTIQKEVIVKEVQKTSSNEDSDIEYTDPSLLADISHTLSKDYKAHLSPKTSKGDKIDKSQIENLKSLTH